MPPNSHIDKVLEVQMCDSDPPSLLPAEHNIPPLPFVFMLCPRLYYTVHYPSGGEGDLPIPLPSRQITIWLSGWHLKNHIIYSMFKAYLLVTWMLPHGALVTATWS